MCKYDSLSGHMDFMRHVAFKFKNCQTHQIGDDIVALDACQANMTLFLCRGATKLNIGSELLEREELTSENQLDVTAHASAL